MLRAITQLGVGHHWWSAIWNGYLHIVFSAGKHLVSIPSVNTVGTYTFVARISNLINFDTSSPFDRALSTNANVNVVSDVPSTKSTMTPPHRYSSCEPAFFYIIAIDRLETIAEPGILLHFRLVYREHLRTRARNFRVHFPI